MKLARIKLRWTLGGMMLLIAVVAMPLAWYVHRVREIGRQRAFAEARTAEFVARMKELEGLIVDLDRKAGHPPKDAPEAVEPPK